VVHLCQVFGELIHEGFGGELLRDRSKSFDIGKENGEICPIAPKLRFLAGSHDFPDQIGRHILPERPQASFHVIGGHHELIHFFDHRMSEGAFLQLKPADGLRFMSDFPQGF